MNHCAAQAGLTPVRGGDAAAQKKRLVRMATVFSIITLIFLVFVVPLLARVSVSLLRWVMHSVILPLATTAGLGVVLSSAFYSMFERLEK